jgi:hypothetical protein
MKPPQAVKQMTGRNKVQSGDNDQEFQDNSRFVGETPLEAYRRPAEQTTQPKSPAATRFAPGSQGLRGGGSGGGAGFKTNTGRKGAVPMPSDFTLNVYAKGGKVGKVGQFGMHRSKPDFAGGGPRTNFKFNTKKGDT